MDEYNYRGYRYTVEDHEAGHTVKVLNHDGVILDAHLEPSKWLAITRAQVCIDKRVENKLDGRRD